jgi:hypothetical protein
MSVTYLGDNNPDGACMGLTSSEKIGFYGTTTIAQRSGSSQAALTLTTATSTGFGFSTSAGFDAFTAQIEEIRATLVALGLMAGS